MTTVTGLQLAPAEVMNRRDLDVKSGDVVRVHIKIQEKGKTRTQIFEGLVLARKHGREMGGTFTVRKISNGVGVERIFPLYSPSLEKIEVVRRSRTRRSKLYFLREKVAREIRRKMRNFLDFTTSTDDLEKIQEAGLAETPDFVEPEEAPEATTDEATAAEESKEEEKSE